MYVHEIEHTAREAREPIERRATYELVELTRLDRHVGARLSRRSKQYQFKESPRTCAPEYCTSISLEVVSSYKWVAIADAADAETVLSDGPRQLTHRFTE